MRSIQCIFVNNSCKNNMFQQLNQQESLLDAEIQPSKNVQNKKESTPIKQTQSNFQNIQRQIKKLEKKELSNNSTKNTSHSNSDNTHCHQPKIQAKKTGLETLKNHIPGMTVSCKSCTFEQVVPGNYFKFKCQMCNNLNNCRPQYNVFRCYYCTNYVTYPIGNAQIVCPKCSKTNWVYDRQQETQINHPVANCPSNTMPYYSYPVMQHPGYAQVAYYNPTNHLNFPVLNSGMCCNQCPINHSGHAQQIFSQRSQPISGTFMTEEELDHNIHNSQKNEQSKSEIDFEELFEETEDKSDHSTDKILSQSQKNKIKCVYDSTKKAKQE